MQLVLDPEGFDGLKRKEGDLRDASQFGTPERLVADQLYQAIRKTIIDQAPDYAQAMSGSETASNLIREMELRVRHHLIGERDQHKWTQRKAAPALEGDWAFIPILVGKRLEDRNGADLEGATAQQPLAGRSVAARNDPKHPTALGSSRALRISHLSDTNPGTGPSFLRIALRWMARSRKTAPLPTPFLVALYNPFGADLLRPRRTLLGERVGSAD